MPRFAANLSTLFPELPFLDRFEAAAEAGFRAVEYLSPYEGPVEEIKARLERTGLETVLINAPWGDWDAGEYGYGALLGEEATFRASLDQALETAMALKVPRIHVMSGVVPGEASREAAFEVLVENLREAAKAAGERNLQVMIEPINDKDVPGYFMNRCDLARRVIDRVGAANLRLQFDIYHVQVAQGDLTRALEENLDLISHIQISGNPGRFEPDASQEINYPYLFDLLDRLGYDGWVGCEYSPRDETRAGLGWGHPYGLG